MTETEELFDLPDMKELHELIQARMPLPPTANLGDLLMMGSLLKGMTDADLADMFIRVLWAASAR